jgi:single-strand DNA-binding protein
MTEPSVSFAGNLTDDPEVRHTEGGIARAMFRVAVSGRREQEPSFFTVIVWRDQAEHAAEGLSKGSRVVVAGRLQQRSWTAEDGSARSTVEVVADELGPSRRWRRRRRPGRHAAASSSQLDRRSGERNAGEGAACQRSAPSVPDARPAGTFAAGTVSRKHRRPPGRPVSLSTGRGRPLVPASPEPC